MLTNETVADLKKMGWDFYPTYPPSIGRICTCVGHALSVRYPATGFSWPAAESK